jgi:hypothetical protein
LVSFLGSAKLFNRIKTSSPLSYLVYSGTIYIFFGLLIGENGFNLISYEIIRHLGPLINFTLGWVGFIFGFQMELKFLKRINGSWFLTLFFTYFAAFLSIFFFSLLVIGHFFTEAPGSPGFALATAVMLAILIPESSIPYVIWSSKLFKKQTENMRLCVFISSIDNFFPILFTGIVFSMFTFLPASSEIIVNNPGNFLLSFSLQFLAGILIGGGVYVLQKRIKERYEIPTIFLGSVFLIAGFSLIFSCSILFVAMVSGAVFSNLTKKTDRCISILGPTEKPIYLVFLIFLGIKHVLFSVEMVLIALALLLIKLNSRVFVFKSLHKFKPRWFNISPYYSYLLLPISSIAPAILLDLQIAFPHGTVSVISGIFIICFILAELFAPAGLKILKRNIPEGIS